MNHQPPDNSLWTHIGREISNEIYNQIVSDGTLSRARLDVYRAIVDLGVCCAKQVERILGKGRRSTVSARFGELVKLGVIEFVEKREFEGRNHGFYRSTNKKPKDVKLTKSTRLLWAAQDISGKLVAFYERYPDKLPPTTKLLCFKEI